MEGGRWKFWLNLTKEAWERSLLFANFFCALHVTTTYFCIPVMPRGPSMLPTLNITGDVIVFERVSHKFGKLNPGDIVFVRSPVNPRDVVTKRLIALEGDTVTYIVDSARPEHTETVVVPKDKIWVEGDNLEVSRDSRIYGSVPYGLLCGRAMWRIWPLKRFGRLEKVSTN